MEAKKSIMEEVALPLLGAIFSLVLIVTTMPFLSPVTFGTNQTTDQTLVIMNITNSEATIYATEISGPSPFTLTPGNTTLINCTAYVFDHNGIGDVHNNTNATFYQAGVSSPDDTDDANYHYTNSSCNATALIPGSTTNFTVSCYFAVEYFANNGTWFCNMTTFDSTNVTTSGNASQYLETLIGIDTPDVINYGNVSTNTYVGDAINITNTGNVPINVSVRTWGGTNETTGNGSSFQCQIGNITANYHRFSFNSSVNWTDKQNLSINFTKIDRFELPQRITDAAPSNDNNVTYFEVFIPLTYFGFCNGTLEFLANSTS